MKIRVTLFSLSLLFAAGAQSLAAILNEASWNAASSPIGDDLTKVAFGAGYFVALAPESGNGAAILVSSDTSTWTEASLPDGIALTDLVFGGGHFFAVGKSGGTPVAVVSTDAAVWTLVEDFPENIDSPLIAAAYAQNQFWAIPETGDLYFSADLIEWNSAVRGPVIAQLAGFENRLLTVRNDFTMGAEWNGTGALSWEGLQSFTNRGAAKSVTAGSDRAVALLTDESGSWFAVTGDGLVWVAFSQSSANLNAVIAAGDRFLAVGEGVILSSTDGARWADRSEGLAGAVVNSAAAGNGYLVAVGNGGAIRQRSSNLPPAILGQPPAETVVSEGQPLILAVEVEGGDEVSVTWERDGLPINGATGKIFQKEAAAPGDAGSYTAMVTTDSGSLVESEAANVSVTGPPESPVAWQEMAALHAFQPPEGGPQKGPPFSRLAAGENAYFAFAHEEDFVMSLHGAPMDELPAGWSENGIHWREALLPRMAFSAAAGSARDLLWIGGQEGVNFSSDGIAWHQTLLEGGVVTLVGEHEGRLFANSGNKLWFLDGETWTSIFGPVHHMGGYFSEEGLLTVASELGLWEWDGETWTQIRSRVGTDHRQPRLAGTRENAMLLGRGLSPHFISRDMENWTSIFSPITRDVINIGGEILSVGEGFAQSSIEGVWWADRSDGLDLATLSTVARTGDFIFAVGDGGKVFRRPAALEPAFYQQPQDVTALPGQPLRLTARAVDDGSVQIQWYRADVAIDGAVGPVLEIPELAASHAGTYTAVASNSAGSASSREAVLTLENPPLDNPWQQVAEIPPLPIGTGPNPRTFVSGHGMTIGVVPHHSGGFAVTQDGGTWVRGELPQNAFPVSFAGHSFFALASNDQGGLISDDGLYWEPTTLPEITSVLYAEGLYVATATDGIYWSEDAETWTQGLESEFGWGSIFLTHGNGRFLVARGEDVELWMSDGGRAWSAGPPPYAPYRETPTGLAFGNGTFVLAVRRSSSSYLYTSSNGEDWSDRQPTSYVKQLFFSTGNFWKYGSNFETSSDGTNWVDRYSPYGTGYDLAVSADGTDIIFQSSERIFRRSALLEPLFYGSTAPESGMLPGEDLDLEAPGAHGTGEFNYQWYRNGEPLPDATGPALTLSGVDAEDRGTYTVEVGNVSGGDSVDFLVRYLALYSEWAEYFDLSDQPRAPGDDPGGRGIPNLLRYALHLDPADPDRSKLPKVTIEGNGGETSPVVRFQLLADANDFEWTVEVSSDLTQWDALEDAVVDFGATVDGRRNLAVRDTRPLDGGKRFYRVQINTTGIQLPGAWH